MTLLWEEGNFIEGVENKINLISNTSAIEHWIRNLLFHCRTESKGEPNTAKHRTCVSNTVLEQKRLTYSVREKELNYQQIFKLLHPLIFVLSEVG